MHTRTTFDYSPLRGPVMDDRGRDISGRSKTVRQQYEQAVNARKEMLKLMENTPSPKNVRRKTWEERMQEKAGKQFVH